MKVRIYVIYVNFGDKIECITLKNTENRSFYGGEVAFLYNGKLIFICRDTEIQYTGKKLFAAIEYLKYPKFQ